MQKLAKKIVVAVLGWQVRRLYKKNDFKTVAVAGSLGKTSTKTAIAQVLSAKYKVRYQGGNYNDIVTVPLIFFGHDLPNLFNPFAWLAIFWDNEHQLRKKYPYDVVVVEVGTDGPGQIKEYAQYLKADIGVLTGIAPEHMEFFGSLDKVAAEEMSITGLVEKLIYSQDLVDQKYARQLPKDSKKYSLKQSADIQITDVVFEKLESSFKVLKNGSPFFEASHELIAQTLLYGAAAAIAVADELGMDVDEIKKGLASIKPASGRMQILEGIKDSTIIDDTYNATPLTFKAALDTLYRLEAPQKIAILGSMNELGDYSPAAHKEVGQYCDPKQIDLLVTIGADANKIMAVKAEARGLKVHRFTNPLAAGEFVKPLVEKGALILAKGSQNKIFAEEAVKLLLANQADASKLVRQSDDWRKRKEKALKGLM